MIPEQLDQEIGEYAKRHGVSKSGSITLILKQYLDQQKLLSKTDEIPEWLKQLAEISRNQKG